MYLAIFLLPDGLTQSLAYKDIVWRFFMKHGRWILKQVDSQENWGLNLGEPKNE